MYILLFFTVSLYSRLAILRMSESSYNGDYLVMMQAPGVEPT